MYSIILISYKTTKEKEKELLWYEREKIISRCQGKKIRYDFYCAAGWKSPFFLPLSPLFVDYNPSESYSSES